MDKINLAPARQIIAQFEGLRLKAYKDPVGIPTIGFGTTRYPDGKKVQLGDVCSEKQANDWLDDYIVKKIFPVIMPALKADVSNNQFCAMISLAYNIGPSGLKRSPLFKRLNEGAPKLEVADLFLRHNKAGGKVLAGLTRRRKAERELFLKG